MNAATESGRVVISDQVIAPQELAARLALARAEVESSVQDEQSGSDASVEARAHRLHELWATVAPPELLRRATTRGHVAFTVKRLVRKVSAWYVEPRWIAQREIDAEVARFASDTAAAIEQLNWRVEHLEQWNDHLQRELRQTQRTTRNMAQQNNNRDSI